MPLSGGIFCWGGSCLCRICYAREDARMMPDLKLPAKFGTISAEKIRTQKTGK